MELTTDLHFRLMPYQYTPLEQSPGFRKRRSRVPTPPLLIRGLATLMAEDLPHRVQPGERLLHRESLAARRTAGAPQSPLEFST